MSTSAVVLMIGICGIVWGGFVVLLGWMMVSERRKAALVEKGREGA